MELIKPDHEIHPGTLSIKLGEGKAAIRLRGAEYTGQGKALLVLPPGPRIQIEADISIPKLLALEVLAGDKTHIEDFSWYGDSISGAWLNLTLTENGLSITWRPFPDQVKVNRGPTGVRSLTFNLFNFPAFFGTERTPEERNGSTEAIHRFTLECARWQVVVQSLHSTRMNYKKLDTEGGYSLSHIGKVRKRDGKSMSEKEIDEVLLMLGRFFSFSVGRWANPVLSVGFDAKGKRVVDVWNSPKEPWRTCLSWFDHHHTTQLEELYRGFAEQWDDLSWRSSLKASIYWYVNANHSERGIDAGIILAQSALELLSYHLVVNSKKMLTASGFKNLWASDKLRLLFSTLGIPINIPADCQELQAASKSKTFNWIDSPHALSEIRNSLVHPDHKLQGRVNELLPEAWKLSLWYLELTILAVCAYRGTYGNRLRTRRNGDVEPVPWI